MIRGVAITALVLGAFGAALYAADGLAIGLILAALLGALVEF